MLNLQGKSQETSVTDIKGKEILDPGLALCLVRWKNCLTLALLNFKLPKLKEVQRCLGKNFVFILQQNNFINEKMYGI